MDNKLRVVLLFGGRSAEHEISLLSAGNVYEALDRSKYEVVLVGIDKAGRWSERDTEVFQMERQGDQLPALQSEPEQVALIAAGDGCCLVGVGGNKRKPLQIDVVFPILHGPFGEDGTVQGLLKLANVAFVGPGVLASAVAMDKDAAKRLLKEAGVPVANCAVLYASQREEIDFAALKEQLGLPLFIKPANMGSSVGVYKVNAAAEFEQRIEKTFQFDNKLLVEEFIAGREVECAVLGNEKPLASGIGEIVSAATHGFYSYDAKYIDADGAKLIIPAELPAAVVAEIQAVAVKAYQSLFCEGLTRVDMFLRGESEIVVNELNTLPGFTNISMYPKLWQQAGVPYSELIDKLIQLGLDRFQRDAKLKSSQA